MVLSRCQVSLNTDWEQHIFSLLGDNCIKYDYFIKRKPFNVATLFNPQNVGNQKQGGRRAREAGAVLTTFQFRKDVIQR